LSWWSLLHLSPPPSPFSGQGHPSIVNVNVDVNIHGQSLYPRPFCHQCLIPDAIVIIGCGDHGSLSLSTSPIGRVNDDDFFHVNYDNDNEGKEVAEVTIAIEGRDGSNDSQWMMMGLCCRPVSPYEITDHALFFMCHLLHALFHASPFFHARKLATQMSHHNAMP